MSVSKTKCLGLDFTQHRPMMAVAEGTQIVECKTLADSPPAALLPIFHGESLIAGAAAHKHRRGIGSIWPPECQAPVYGNYQNGVGRIPLVCAWAKLTKSVEEGFSGSIGDTDINWRPTGKHDISIPSERLITESTIAWEKEYANKKTSIVVPDSLDEAAQQALIDDFNAFLTPRPVAVALSWCRRKAENYQGEGNRSEEGLSIGHLLVITMALDQWEVVPIEIRAKIFDKKTWLVPVRSRVHKVGHIPRTGVGLFMGISIPGCDDEGEVWQFAFGSEKASSFADGKIVLDHEQINALREYIRTGWTDRDRRLFSLWDIWTDLYSATSVHMKIAALKEEIVSLYKRQVQYFNDVAAEQCLGVVIDGACARIRVAEERRVGDIIAEAFEAPHIEITDGFDAVRGAAYTSAALEKGMPCYRETILPIEIHYHRRNELGDLENAWKMLIEGMTVRAGSEYKSKTPVEGLQIKQGEKILRLTLRRPSDKDEFIHRKVSAEIPEETRQDEPVRISVSLQPGQGFAKVTIDSVREGVFRTLLNWKTMERCDPPLPPPLAYLPRASRIIHDEEMWLGAEAALYRAIQAIRGDSPDLLHILRKLLKHIDRWPLADTMDGYRGRPLKGDIFLHYGVFPSDGNLKEVHSQSLANEFARECEAYFSRRGISTKKRELVQRTASWLYLACPSVIIESVRKNLKQGFSGLSKSEIQLDLHTIGLCFEAPDDIQMFFAALEKRFQKKHDGINDWLRAGRNIVRFREHVLKPEVVDRSRLENIFLGIIRSLEHEVKNSNFKFIFDNCVLLSLYLLKRRRYEPDFLAPGSQNHGKLDEILSGLIKKRRRLLSDRRYKIVSITLKFLHQEASYDDLKGIMVECS